MILLIYIPLCHQYFFLVRPCGLVYFTSNFDGVTSLEPTITEADLDRQVIALYHETMDHRLVFGKPSGDSKTGRHSPPFLQKSGFNILDAGSSDWVVFATNGSYRDHDAYFLHFIVDTIYRAIQFYLEINPDNSTCGEITATDKLNMVSYFMWPTN